MALTVKLFADDINFPTNGAFEGDIVAGPILFSAEILRIQFFGFHIINACDSPWTNYSPGT